MTEPPRVTLPAPSRGAVPRHPCAEYTPVFVHAPFRPRTAPVADGKGKTPVKKIVQNCALLCSFVSTV
ncbi:hypothetical protein F2191_24480, partial [Salmonella enterica]|nr:hypothetical protein [Salmonella enterica]